VSESTVNDQALRQAAEWFAILQDTSTGDSQRKQWQSWLAASPAHLRAWQRVERIDQSFRELPAGPSNAALGAAGKRRRKFLSGLAGIAMAGPLGWAVWRFSPMSYRGDLVTAVGEARETALPDGGQLWLNTNTAVDLQFDEAQRQLTLLRGEILIETARDRRQFRVVTPQGVITPLGTRFNVRIDQGQTRVAVTTGRVEVRPLSNPLTSDEVAAGHSVQFDESHVGKQRIVAIADTAWQKGLLVADDMPLGEFLDELARYRHGWIRYDDAVSRLRLVGTFPIDDTDLVLDSLARTLPIKVSQMTPWWVSVEHHE
jgi:transmembrane sensor